MKIKYPLSLREAKTASLFFKDIMELHFNKGAKILDLTCGEGLLWYDIDTRDYKIQWSDKYYKSTKKNFILSDYKELPTKFNGVFDGVIFDPPYLFGIKTSKDKREKKYGEYKQTYAELMNLIHEAPQYLIKYIKTGGKIVLKCSDQYYCKEHKFYELSRHWSESFSILGREKVFEENPYISIGTNKLNLIDKHIFPVHHISPTAWQVKDRNSSIQNYTLFLVFQKYFEEAQND